MSGSLERDIKKYKRSVRSSLICGTKTSRKFMEELSDSIDNYIAENGVTEISEVTDHFGTPEFIAKGFLAEADLGEIRKKIRLRKAISIALLVAVLIWGIGVTIAVIDSFNQSGGYGIEHPVVEIEDTTDALEE